MPKTRKVIPKNTERELLVECGFMCSVPHCGERVGVTNFHHINGDPSDNRKENLIVLCEIHHRQATKGDIDAKSCEMMRELLKTNANTNSHPLATVDVNPPIPTVSEGFDELPSGAGLFNFITDYGEKYSLKKYGNLTTPLTKEKIVLGIVGVVLIVMPLWAFIEFKAQYNAYSMMLIVISIIIGALFIDAVNIIENTKCEKCNSYFSRKIFDSKLIKEKIKKIDERKIQEKEYLITYQCANCGNIQVSHIKQEKDITKNT